ncbi:MAG: ArdC-like ssDNA-binding domain-containing protein [Verrucomicrobiota bacterium]
MATSTRKPTQTPRREIYERVTEIVIERLEEGVAPWQSPSIAKAGFPRNFLTKHFYQGVDVFLLGCMGYASPWFLTYKQAQQLGGQVRKGEKGHLIVKYGTFEKEDENPQTGDLEATKRGYLRGYTVFNSSQIDGIEFPEIVHPEYESSESVALAQKIIEGMPKPPALEEGAHACPNYNPKADLFGMPTRMTFPSEERFHESLFHEFTHATGHASRLARKTLLENKGIMAGGTDRTTYAKEELVAEMGAAFLTAHAGIVMDEFENSAAYLQGWLSVLKAKQNRRWIVEAASQAQRACDFVLGQC